MAATGNGEIRRGASGFALVWALVTAPLSVLADAAEAMAGNGDCGQPSSAGGAPLTSDALYVLKTSVGSRSCELCVCDTNGNGVITAPDALLDLRKAVGQGVQLKCPPCDVTTTTSTTTTTLGNCPPEDGLDGVAFTEKYTCNQVLGNQQPTCADLNVVDPVKFIHTGNGNYEVRDVPDTGFVLTGKLSCTTFVWTASEPGEYTENGSWEFTSNLHSFSGSSMYTANNLAYYGSCNETGSSTGTPPNPPPVSPCP